MPETLFGGRETRRSRIVANLIGFRVVERGTDYVVFRFPIWMSSSMIDQVIEKTVADATVLGKHPCITRGNRLVRVDSSSPGKAG